MKRAYTHRQILTIRRFLTFHHGTMDIGNDDVGIHDTALKLGDDSVGVHSIVPDVGNDGVGIRDIVANVRNDHICIYRKFGLGVNS